MILLLTILGNSASRQTEQEANYRIRPMGQSNCIGGGAIADLSTAPLNSDPFPFTAEQSRVYIWDPGTNTYEKLHVGVNNLGGDDPDAHQDGTPTGPYPAFGPELGIAQRWMQERSSNEYLYIDKDVRDGSSINIWVKSANNQYPILQSRNEARDAWFATRGKNFIDIGFVWIQGEGDSGDSQSVYESKLSSFISDLLADGLLDGAANQIITQVPTNSIGYGAGVAAAKISYVDAHAQAQLLTYPSTYFYDNLHMNAAGQLQFGYNIYELLFDAAPKWIVGPIQTEDNLNWLSEDGTETIDTE